MTLAECFPRVTRWRGRHVVVVNWRDGRHPEAGGAELYCEEVARELTAAGVRVTFLTARPPGTARRERTEFGTVVRGGGRLTVYPFALLWLLLRRRTVDGVIDSQNGIPFFAPLALRRRTPVVLLIHHVHQDQFAVWFPRPVAALGRWLENRGTRLVYGTRAVAAVSPSSRAEIRARLSLRGPVHLAPCGRRDPARAAAPHEPAPHEPAPEPAARRPGPAVVCVGRLVRQKRVDRLIACVPALREEFPGLRLDVVGDGEARAGLEKQAAALGIGDAVVFHGRVGDAERDRLVAGADLTATASTGEGWGLSVMEAAALGVPAVAHAVPGLRDTILPGRTGWLAAPADDLTATLAAALREVADPARARRAARECRAWAARYGWDATAGHLLAPLTTEHDRLRHLRAPDRSVTDACVLVTLPADRLPPARLGALRATDLVDTSGPRTALLLVGADEHDATGVLARLGIDPPPPAATDPEGGEDGGPEPGARDDDRVTVRLARQSDTLGWRSHPPAAEPDPAAPAGGPAPDRTGDAGPRRPALRRWRPALLAALFVLALALRLWRIHRSYDLFIDEITYATVGRNLASGAGLTLYGRLFALHPPAFFALIAAAVRAGGPHGSVLSLVMALRPLDAVAGSVTAVAVTVLLARTVRPGIAWTCGLLLACDPFLNRFDSRLLLEAPATAAAALGILLLARAPATTRARIATGTGAGLLFALSITTKELYALVTIAPLAVLAFTARGPVRRTRALAAAVTVAGYGVYVAATVAAGQWHAWWQQKYGGIARAVGTRQITGFHQKGTAPSAGFTARLLADLGQFGVSYALIALGGAATVWLLVRRLRRPWLFTGAPARSVVTAWAAGAVVFLLYAGAFGTLEEQMFYPLVVTSTAALALAADLALPRGRPAAPGAARARRPLAVRLTAAVAVLALAGDAGVWAIVHTRRDDSYRRAVAWSRTHIPEGSTVDVTEGSGQFLLTGVRLGTWDTVADVRRHHADYLLMSTRLVEQGYSRVDPALIGALHRDGRLVHSESGPTNGQLRIYDVRGLRTAAPAGGDR